MRNERPSPTSRANAVDAVTVLDRIVGDIISGAQALRVIQSLQVPHPQVSARIEDLCVAQLVLAGCKFVEFYKHFHHVLDDAERASAKGLIREINERRLVDFRNAFVGHIWNRGENRILLDSEAREMIGRVTKGDPAATLEWIMPTDDKKPESVYAIVTGLLNTIRERYAVTATEAKGR
jgi:hypothetical protein